ncbi:hypothetical protein M406DRAFT_73347 [Cryphonectria parasitica EP155]|uniref:DUF6924 domain-containing protein n=1 Tax=Cryphonectria parasitica (strain ATCC 38755 / EP155) TaxID=660469 RepID=A0A9P4XTX5_CRYP1|nr:uncharacterized protein M406DRAFT_73347 [Cryphonectria parasitica EP155]KAF3760888.1 hypothetical protein M406DRAFT_73347 [Cryphonectria parasitica EP155]
MHRDAHLLPGLRPALVAKMSVGLLFVIAPEANENSINRCLLHLKDWEYGSGDRFRIVTSKSTDALLQCLVPPPHPKPDAIPQLPETSAPVPPSLVEENEWAGASISDVEAFCLALSQSETRSLNYSEVVVLDAEGIDKQTCVLMSRPYDMDYFEKCRFPWYQTYLIWCNLDIANMDWEDYVGEEPAEGMEERWRTSIVEDQGEFLSDENRKLRDKAIRELEDLDKA